MHKNVFGERVKIGRDIVLQGIAFKVDCVVSLTGVNAGLWLNIEGLVTRVVVSADRTNQIKIGPIVMKAFYGIVHRHRQVSHHDSNIFFGKETDATATVRIGCRSPTAAEFVCMALKDEKKKLGATARAWRVTRLRYKMVTVTTAQDAVEVCGVLRQRVWAFWGAAFPHRSFARRSSATGRVDVEVHGEG